MSTTNVHSSLIAKCMKEKGIGREKKKLRNLGGGSAMRS